MWKNMYAILKKTWKRLTLLCLVILLIITAVNRYTSPRQTGLSSRTEYISKVRVQSNDDLQSLISEKLNLQNIHSTPLGISTPTTSPRQQHGRGGGGEGGRGGGGETGGEGRGGGGGGFVLAEDFWEQQTSGSRNLQNLQCWAGQLRLKVVEPFVIDSVPKTPLSNDHTTHKQHSFRFSDLFDLQSWNKQSKELHHAELVPWEEFLQHAPRELIIVDIKYSSSSEVKEKQKLVKMNPGKFPPQSERYKIGCKHVELRKKEKTFLLQNNFHVNRKVCFNFEYGDKLFVEQLNQHIFAGNSSQSVTVAFKMWRGLGDIGRVTVRDSPCQNTDIQANILPGLELTQMAETYRTKYLNGSNYIAVMARIEKSKIALHREGVVTYCLNQIIKYLDALRATSGIETVFLSTDIGEFGSNSFRNTGDTTNLEDEFVKFFRQLYGDTMSTSEWASTFRDTASTSDAGYIALLQKSVATHAKCIVFVGGGAFQKHALNLYKQQHPQREEQCIRIITECTPANNLSL